MTGRDNIGARFIPEVRLIRVDFPGEGYQTNVLLTTDRAMRLLTALKVALAESEPAAVRKPVGRPRKAVGSDD